MFLQKKSNLKIKILKNCCSLRFINLWLIYIDVKEFNVKKGILCRTIHTLKKI